MSTQEIGVCLHWLYQSVLTEMFGSLWEQEPCNVGISTVASDNTHGTLCSLLCLFYIKALFIVHFVTSEHVPTDLLWAYYGKHTLYWLYYHIFWNIKVIFDFWCGACNWAFIRHICIEWYYINFVNQTQFMSACIKIHFEKLLLG